MEEAAGLAGEAVGRGLHAWSGAWAVEHRPATCGAQGGGGAGFSLCAGGCRGLCCGCVLRGSAQALDGLPCAQGAREPLPDTVGQFVQ